MKALLIKDKLNYLLAIVKFGPMLKDTKSGFLAFQHDADSHS